MTTFRRPEVRFHCDVNFDPFVYMHENNKTYGSFLFVPLSAGRQSNL